MKQYYMKTKKLVRAAALALTALVGLPAVSTPANAAVSSEITVFKNSGHNYRIPAIAVNPNTGRLLAVCDDRGNSTDDVSGTIVYKTSDDNGKTWSQAKSLPVSQNHRYGDPAITYDEYNDCFVVMLVSDYAWGSQNNAGGIWCVKGTNGSNGDDWEEPEEVAAQFVKNSGLDIQRGFVSSASMLYVSDPARNTSHIYCVLCGGKFGNSTITNYVFRSENQTDGSYKWEVLNTKSANMGDEAHLANLDTDQNFIMSVRTDGGYRKFTWSSDGGMTWDPLTASSIPAAAINGDILRYVANDQLGTDYLLQSIVEKRPGTVYVHASPTQGKTWTKKLDLGANGEYSTLVRLYDGSTKNLDGNVGCLYERSDNGTFSIYFKTFNFQDDIIGRITESDEVFDGTLKCDTKRYAEVAHDAAQKYAVKANGVQTMTARLLMSTEGSAGATRGAIATRVIPWTYDNCITEQDTENRCTKTSSGYSKPNTVNDHLAGFEIYAGATDDFFGVNVSVPQTYAENGYLTNWVLSNTKKADFITTQYGKWVHVAWVYDPQNKNSLVYINGKLFERQGTKGTGDQIPQDGTNLDANGNAWNMGNNAGIDYSKLPGKGMEVPQALLMGARYTHPNDIKYREKAVSTGSSWWGSTTYYGYWYNPGIWQDKLWGGSIDDVHFYNEALSEEDVKKDLEWRFPIRSKASSANTLIGAYDFAEYNRSDNQFKDISGHGTAAPAKGVTTKSGDAFPVSDNSYSVIPLSPLPEEGTLTVTYFEDGMEKELQNDVNFDSSRNRDYKVTVVPTENYELVGIYVNGQEVNYCDFTGAAKYGFKEGIGGFFKASGKNNQVYAIWRHKGEGLKVYLVGDFSKNKRLEAYRFHFVLPEGEAISDNADAFTEEYTGSNPFCDKPQNNLGGYYYLDLDTDHTKNPAFGVDGWIGSKPAILDGLTGDYHVEIGDSHGEDVNHLRMSTYAVNDNEFKYYAHVGQRKALTHVKVQQELNKRHEIQRDYNQDINNPVHFTTLDVTGADTPSTYRLVYPSFELILNRQAQPKTLAIYGDENGGTVTGVEDITGQSDFSVRGGFGEAVLEGKCKIVIVNLQGMVIYDNAIDGRVSVSLPAGPYIANGKKFIVR